MPADYGRAELARAFIDVGMRRGDVVFSHGNVGFFGTPEGGMSRQNTFQTALGAFREALGPEGTLAVPTFTYSFCKGEPFDPDHTPSPCGMFTEMVRMMPEARRSADPIFSVAVVGPKARALTDDPPEYCFAPESFWGRLLAEDGLICNLNFDAGSTFIHYVESELKVPYRFRKMFEGTLVRGGRGVPARAGHYCRDLDTPGAYPMFELFDQIARRRGLARSARVGRGAVVAIRARATYDLIKEEIVHIPDLLTEAARPKLTAAG